MMSELSSSLGTCATNYQLLTSHSMNVHTHKHTHTHTHTKRMSYYNMNT